MTYRELIRDGVCTLETYDIPDASVDAWVLFEYITKMSRASYLMDQNQKASDELKEKYGNLIKLRSKHIPLQYITHEQSFMGYDFYVDENVLIPRLDTEVLVETIVPYLRPKMNVLDMCTGSGCILISLALLGQEILGQEMSGTGVDLSEGALNVAKKNALSHGQTQLNWIHSDLFTNLNHEELDFDLIVSNPPYICTEVVKSLMPEVQFHEPMMALDGFEDGLFFYRKIVDHAPLFLKKNGYLFFEIGHDQAEAVSKLMHEKGFCDINIKKDLALLDRIVYGYWPG